MSSYANYFSTDTVAQYAKTRPVVGAEAILGAAVVAASKTGATSLSRVEALDVGCGPGNHVDLLGQFVARVDAVDNSLAMLTYTSSRIHPPEKVQKVDLNEPGWGDSLEEYDVILCSQVLQHLRLVPPASADASASEKFVGAQVVLNECFRLLRPGGALVINLCTAKQRREGFWWASLIPNAVEKFIARVPQSNDVRQMLAAAGFSTSAVDKMRIHQQLSETLQCTEEYTNLRGPLLPEWRATDSTWALASEQELEGVAQFLKFWIEADAEEAEKYRKHMDRADLVGQNTSYIVYKE